MWGYQVFARNLTWYFIGVYIIKGVIYPSKSVFELAKSIRRTVRNRARGTDLSWERHRFWNTHSNNILHQLKTSLLKDWINERLNLSSSTSIIRSLSFSRLNRRCSIFLQSGRRYLRFFIFWWVHIATLLEWLSRCGAFDERRDDSNFFSWTMWEAGFCCVNSPFSRCSGRKCFSYCVGRRNRNTLINATKI